MGLCTVVLFVCLWIHANAFFFNSERCCEDVGYTCFQKYRGMVLPRCVLPKFMLYTRELRDQGEGEKYPGVPVTAQTIPAEYNSTKKTIFIVHGWKDGPEESEYSWLFQLRDALIDKEDVNLIITDWSSHSKTRLTNYGQAAADTRVAGKAIHDVFSALISNGLERSQGHCIGHSLGSHICGFAGKYLAFGRVTALDPAGPGFEMSAAEHRVSQSDADFVDVIHTDGGGFTLLDYGTLVPMGHVDFYPNGGKNQRGCKMNRKRRSADIDQPYEVEEAPVLVPSVRKQRDLKKFEEDAKKAAFTLLGCSHMRAISLYITSITSDCLRATATCAIARKKYLGFCIRMKDPSTYPVMGYYTDPSTRGLYHLATGATMPFCPGTGASEERGGDRGEDTPTGDTPTRDTPTGGRPDGRGRGKQRRKPRPSFIN